MLNKNNALLDINFIINKLHPKEKQVIADLGCGKFGFFIWPLGKKVGKYGTIYAVDVIKQVLDEIKRKAKTENLPQIKTVWSDLEIFKATKIESNSLDSALLINVLNQSHKRTEILREATRLLKRGGSLMIVEWKDENTPLGPLIENRIKLKSLKLAILKLGLNIREEFDAGQYHYGLILTKL